MILASTHRNTRIYVDYQASTPVDEDVFEAMSKYFRSNPANPHANDHAYGWESARAVHESSEAIASALHCDPDEVIFTSGATEANNLVLLGLAARASGRRRRILMSVIEHKSVLAAAEAAARRYGCSIERVPVDDRGRLLLDELERRLDGDVLLVSVMAVNNEIGTIEPIAEIGEMCAAVGAIFHTDAAQALAAGPIHTDAISVDAVSLSGHKIYGPKGIGALFLRRELHDQIEPMIVGGGQQNSLRAGTLPVPLCVGLAVAVERMGSDRGAREREQVAETRNRFARQMLRLPDVALNGPPLQDRHPGNCNFRFEGCDGRDLLSRLQPWLAASTGSACTSGNPEPSHVLRALGLSNEDAMSSIRFSFGRYSTNEDADKAAELLRACLADRREVADSQ